MTLKQHVQELLEHQLLKYITVDEVEKLTKQIIYENKLWLDKKSILKTVYPKCMQELAEDLE